MDNRHELERQRNHNGLVFNHHMRGGLPDLQTTKPGMFDLKTFITIIAHVIGVPSTVLTIFLNVGDWKASLTAILAIGYLFIRIVWFCIKKYQDWREKEIELENKRKRYEQEIKDIWD